MSKSGRHLEAGRREWLIRQFDWSAAPGQTGQESARAAPGVHGSTQAGSFDLEPACVDPTSSVNARRLLGVLRDSEHLHRGSAASVTFAGAADYLPLTSVAAPAAHEDLPIFSAGHEEPHRTVHIEGLARIAQASSVHCFQRQQKRFFGKPLLTLSGFETDSTAAATEVALRLLADVRRYNPLRAPSRA